MTRRYLWIGVAALLGVGLLAGSAQAVEVDKQAWHLKDGTKALFTAGAGLVVNVDSNNDGQTDVMTLGNYLIARLASIRTTPPGKGHCSVITIWHFPHGLPDFTVAHTYNFKLSQQWFHVQQKYTEPSPNGLANPPTGSDTRVTSCSYRGRRLHR